MFYTFGLYIYYCFFYAYHYKTEIVFVSNLIKRYLIRPRIKMDIRPLIRRQIMILHNYI